MAPKRGATAAAAPGRPSKKSNPSTGSQNNRNDAPAPTIPRSKRWTPLISCSANVDMEYKIATQDPETAYRHGAYGVLEVLQNLILDFEEAKDNLKERWAICEALAFFLNTNTAMGVVRYVLLVTSLGEQYNDTGLMGWHGVDGTTVTETYLIIGRLFLTALAQLEREDLLKEDSEIENIGLIMALFMAFSRTAKRCSQLLYDEYRRQSLVPAKDKRKWEPRDFHHQIASYASKYGISLVGPHDIDDLVAKAKSDADLPLPASNTPKADVFGFAKNLKRYKEEQNGLTAWMALTHCFTPIGGDSLDITTWSSDKRKEKHFEEKDPLTQEHLEALAQGKVISVASVGL
ncbi:hypothetical protein CHGG_02387 [Chaetomium globosum CBS 148.51]|uniref:Uncharacterized protein n=1 Tax=Chaetomium globosum (strain ATCC 6205 / CBS 148.51 / DSM 1962 / NBRC 6347 / NRRL 1970) TaxID=306901 RepID=Q2HBL7_CHAGB|nr:uncharacterized protein CHGG_02387 [Chaetomium globosum CBS 148.51]EAQ90452.1 hypothetical protein CHGG_02387 [Chaetomium globosum CBS 148.51]